MKALKIVSTYELVGVTGGQGLDRPLMGHLEHEKSDEFSWHFPLEDRFADMTLSALLKDRRINFYFDRIADDQPIPAYAVRLERVFRAEWADMSGTHELCVARFTRDGNDELDFPVSRADYEQLTDLAQKEVYFLFSHSWQSESTAK